ncbi:sensor histidine kinase [Allorhizocola rhizosphaerae]|uniref:sensor histidine kinase n=1 Tax=Allorhizocola rhizosphaerae TaxID=1872709 RepID=UPI0013C344ED|nr:sensor histidine kinase [Allorhizocola rhizosphaerae]
MWYSWLTARPRLLDVLFALGVALPFAPGSFVTIEPGLPAAWRHALHASVVLAHVALITRRVWPAWTFAVVSAAMAVQAVAPAQAYRDDSFFLPSAVVFPVALYSLCVWGTAWQRWAGIGVGVAGSVMLTVRSGFPFMFGLLAVVVLASWGFARLREERARQLELDKQERVTAERERIAREMHDVIVHSLSVIITQAQGGELIAAKSPERAARALSTIAAAGREALAEMRGVLAVLDPTLDALPRLLDRVRATGLDAGLEVRGEMVPLGPSAELAVYRLIQEALTNAMRHSGASRADVTLDWTTPGRLVVIVRDNGSGPVQGWAEGRGLTGMRERLAAVGGKVQVLTDNGFEVRGVLPA